MGLSKVREMLGMERSKGTQEPLWVRNEWGGADQVWAEREGEVQWPSKLCSKRQGT